MRYATIQEMVTEAIDRMNTLHLHPNVIQDFRRGRLNYSEQGFLYWLTDEQEEKVVEFQKECGGVVYHVIKNNTEFGEMYTYLYVTKNKEEWEMDREDLRAGYPVCYVDSGWCSEFGSIGIQPRFGGVIRTA